MAGGEALQAGRPGVQAEAELCVEAHMWECPLRCRQVSA